MKPRWPAIYLVLLLGLPHAQSQVVINEIFYHAPNDLNDLQWIELHNTTDQAVSLTGWRLTKGTKCTFGAGASIPGGGYVVVCKDKKVFHEFYEVTPVAEFEKPLKHNTEKLELRDSSGRVVDSVRFSNHVPWSRGPDGRTASLERICPSAAGNLPENWAGSPLAEDSTRPGGTPGAKNAAFSANLPPVISNVTFPSNTVAPGQSLHVEAQVRGKSALKEVTLRYRLVLPGSVSEEKTMPMSPRAGSSTYAADIPGQAAGQIVRFRVQAVDQTQAERFYPSPTELQPALSCLVFTNGTPSRIPIGFLIHTDDAEAQSARQQVESGARGAPTGPEGQARFMAQMQLREALDLPLLWASLTLTNCPPEDIEKLRSIFRQQEKACDLLEQQVLSSTNAEQALRGIPELVKPVKAALGDSLKDILRAEQIKSYDAWREASASNGPRRGRQNDAAGVLRQVIRLEPDYLHLACSTNITSTQLGEVVALYRAAIQERDAMVPDVQKLMSSQGPENREEGEKLREKAEAIPADLDKKLKRVLSSSQVRQLAAWRLAGQPSFMHHARAKTAEPVLGDSAFVYIDPKTGVPRLFDFVRIPQRSGGWKVHFAKDQSLNGMSVVDLVFESSDRWLLAEPLAYDLHRRAGLAACRTDFIRLTVDDQPAGYYLLIEQPNKSFLRSHGLRDDGNLYKVNWMGNGLVGQHEKHINRQTGHQDLVTLVEQLEKAKDRPEEQWALIRREFDVDEVLNHYAVRMLISDWDGFFNNYFLYHDIGGTGRWTFYPWDEDKTWGEYDGWEQEGTLYNMPLSYGAEGDHPPGEAGGRASNSYGFRSWWRAGGYVSRPLLANPTFRKLFLARVKDLLDTEFTEARLFPLVNGFRDRLKDEITYRALVTKEDPDKAMKRFESNLASLKEFITKRRQWLLDQEEIRTAGHYDRAAVQ